MADKTTHHILDALRRAAVEPAGAALYAGKGVGGLFPAHAAGKLAAQRCKDDGYLRVVRTEPRGKNAQEVCALTDAGLAYLLREGNPRQLLEDLIRAVEGREAQLAELLALVRSWQDGLAGLRELVTRLLPTLADASARNGHPGPALGDVLLQCLADWHAGGTAEDCPLPELYRRARARAGGLTLGAFHDILRSLKEQERVYLHPWTGPLYALPQPACAMLSGHEVAYYASLRATDEHG